MTNYLYPQEPTRFEPQFSLSTAGIAPVLYPALGGADARNEGRESRFSPLRSPIAGIIFYENFFYNPGIIEL